eukprot:g1934.t1
MTRNLDECCTARSYYALAGAAASCAGQRSALQSRAPLAQRRREAIQLLLRKTREAYAREGAGKDANYIAPFSPSPAEMVDIVLDRIKLSHTDVVYDLGCGDGRWLLGAARRGARAIGVEVDAALVARARRASEEAGTEVSRRIEVVEGDLYAMLDEMAEATRGASTSAARSGVGAGQHNIRARAAPTVVIVYAFANALTRIQNALAALPPGTRLVSVGFTPKNSDGSGAGGASTWEAQWTTRVAGLRVSLYVARKQMEVIE